jgi:Ca-activated chloride channel homolog
LQVTQLALRSWGLRLAASLAASVVASMTAGLPAHSQDQAAAAPSVMIVFDASGSMWGRMEGERPAKFIQARDALKTSITKLPSGARVGMTLFGHRRQGDCTDVQVALPAEPGTVERHLAPLEKLNPKGRGPVAQALKDAAKALGGAPAPRSLILIHDDQDNCSADPCAALAELQTAAPGVTIHVLGMAVKEAPQRLLCLAEPTGGRLVEIANAAAIQQALDDILSGPTSRAPQTPPSSAPSGSRPQPQATTPPTHAPADARRPLTKTGPSAIRLNVQIGRNKALDARNPSWTVASVERPNDIFRATGQDVTLPVPPGRYDITANDGLVVGRTTITVAPEGETPSDIVLSAGVVSLKFPDPAPPRDSLAALTMTVMELDVASGKPKALAVFNGLELTETGGQPALAPGNYVIRLEANGLRVDRPAIVAAGAVTELDGTLGAGRVLITIQSAFDDQPARPGEVIPPTLIQVFEDDPEAARGRREIARAAGSTADFALPAGTYTIVAKRDGAQTRERIALIAGANQTTILALQSARLSIASNLKATANTTALESLDAVAFKLTRLDVVPPEIVTATRRNPTFEVVPGRYRVEMRHGNGNARSSFEVTLEPGQHQRLAVEQPAGVLELSFGASAPPIDLTWDIRTAEGASIYASAQPDPKVVLLAGTYTVRAETRGRRLERRIAIPVGQRVKLDISEGR